MTKQEAERVLGLSALEMYDLDILNSTYRRLAKEKHPDVVVAAGGSFESACREIALINEAADYLRALFSTSGASALTPESNTANFVDVPVGKRKACGASSNHNQTESRGYKETAEEGPERRSPYQGSAQRVQPAAEASQQSATSSKRLFDSVALRLLFRALCWIILAELLMPLLNGQVLPPAESALSVLLIPWNMLARCMLGIPSFPGAAISQPLIACVCLFLLGATFELVFGPLTYRMCNKLKKKYSD